MSFLKFNSYPKSEKARIIHEFWREYFEKHPDPGSMPELNEMRNRMNAGGYPIGMPSTMPSKKRN